MKEKYVEDHSIEVISQWALKILHEFDLPWKEDGNYSVSHPLPGYSEGQDTSNFTAEVLGALGVLVLVLASRNGGKLGTVLSVVMIQLIFHLREPSSRLPLLLTFPPVPKRLLQTLLLLECLPWAPRTFCDARSLGLFWVLFWSHGSDSDLDLLGNMRAEEGVVGGERGERLFLTPGPALLAAPPPTTQGSQVCGDDLGWGANQDSVLQAKVTLCASSDSKQKERISLQSLTT